MSHDASDLRDRLDDIETRLEAAEREAEYQQLAEDLDALEEAIAAIDEEHRGEDIDAIEDALEAAQETLDAKRGPYVADVFAVLDALASTLEDDRWTETGTDSVVEAVRELVAIDLPAFESIDPPTDVDMAAACLESASEHLSGAGLDPDADAAAIERALRAAEDAREHIDSAERFSDLPVREQLRRDGFYDILEHTKDFPPEWSAIKAHEEAGNVDMILLALDRLDSQFFEGYCLEALKRLGSPAAIDAMVDRASRRDRDAIEVLGRIGDDACVDLLVDFLGEDAQQPLELTTLEALGRIGSSEATEAVAQRLQAEDRPVRSTAARTLGMIGDARAIDPLVAVLADDDEAGPVRGSAAWALTQIGTTRALEVVMEYQDDRAYLVQRQANRAREREPVPTEPPA